VRVHYGEGVAPHTGPEPCASTREGTGEASAGECTGQLLSRVSNRSRVPTRFSSWKATWKARYRERLKARRGRRPWHVQTLLGREPGDLAADQRRQPLARIGKARSRSR
jgi:hypothetical protein